MNLDLCDRDLTGLPEWVRADYFQAHKDHGCLWADAEPAIVKPKRLTAMITFRVTSAEHVQLREAAAKFGVPLSDYIRARVLAPVAEPGEGA